jgi:hypothetical protein
MRIACALSFALVVSFTATTFAGYTVQTGIDGVANTDNPPSGATLGDSFTVSQGTFAAYAPDTILDPQINGGDLGNYGYTLTGNVANVTGLVVNYTGTYEIFYNLDGNNTLDAGDLRVSAGNFAAQATFTPTNTAVFTGTLTQTQGAENPAFSDLSYGGNPVSLVGNYVGNPTNPLVGTLESTLRQNTPVPEPSSVVLALLGAVAIGYSRARKQS